MHKSDGWGNEQTERDIKRKYVKFKSWSTDAFKRNIRAAVAFDKFLLYVA